MKFITLISAILSVCLSVGIAKPIAKREVGGVLICNGPNATGNCTYQKYEMGTCYNMTAGFYQNAATFAPDGEDFYCYPYIMPCDGLCTSPTGCTFGAIDFKYENKYNLSVIGWDRYIASFRCHLNTTTETSP